MSTWKQFALVNAAAVIAILIALFTISPTTRLGLWATTSAFVLIAGNYLIFRRQRRKPAGRAYRLMGRIAVGLCAVMLLMELIFRSINR